MTCHEISDQMRDETEDDNENDDEETIAVTEFEDERLQDDPNFNVQDVFNNTMKVVAKRKERWHKTGIDKVMDSFYTDKVGDWLNNRCCSSVIPCIDEMEIQDRQVYVDHGSDQDSLESVDTAKYILSSRKQQKTRVRTMTIKRFCFSKRRMEELEREKKNSSVNIREDRYSEFGNRKHSQGKYRKRFRQYTTSSSSSSNYLSDSESKYTDRVMRKRWSRKRPKIRKSRELCGREKVLSDTKKPQPFETDSLISSNSNTDLRSSEIRFRPENVLNSTTFSENKIQHRSNSSKLSKIEEHISILSDEHIKDILPPLSNLDNISNDKSKRSNSTPPPIVIYTPGEGDNSLHLSKSIVSGKLIITSKILEETIGPKLAKIYLGEKQDFSHGFDMQSKILFYPPEEDIETSDSEADVLETMSTNKRGRIVEIVDHCNSK